ncbi:MAG: DUF4870 domain-containing protein [Chloroflexi bacterium]|nr:DUF4870 domain-containing protein [Chloroflexota bacterium]
MDSEALRLSDRLLATAIHLCALLNFFLPVLGATLAIMGIQRLAPTSAYIQAQGREALAFELFYFTALVSFIAIFMGQLYCLPIAPFLILFGLYCSLSAAVSAWRGQTYRYPFTSRLIGA